MTHPIARIYSAWTSEGVIGLLAMMESVLFLLNSFSTCAGTVSATCRVQKSRSDLSRHQYLMTHAIVREVGDCAAVYGDHSSGACALAACPHAAAVMPLATLSMGRRYRSRPWEPPSAWYLCP
jgi:hypothetical protein